MSDLISRQHAIDEIRFYITEPDISDDETKIEGYNDGLEMAISILSILSSAEPERKKGEREEGEWIMHKMLSRDYGKIYYQHDCSCNLYESPYPFCPNCGMKMKRGD